MSKKKMKKQNPMIKERMRMLDQVEMGEVEKKERMKPLPRPKKCWVVAEGRIGVFNISAVMMEYAEWDIWQQFTQNFMINGCQISPDKKTLQFMAFSPLFEKVSKLEPKKEIPFYQIKITVDRTKESKERKVKVEAEKIERSKIIGSSKGLKILGKDGKEIKL